MKLLRLKINDNFRSLQKGFEVRFLQDVADESIQSFMPYCLVGRNGSGKSNVLESLASIFYHLECMHLRDLPDNFVYDEEKNPHGFNSNKAAIDAFEIEYLIEPAGAATSHTTPQFSPYAHVLVTKDFGAAPVAKWLNRPDFEKNSELVINNLELERFLPDYIIGYSSGENEILSLPFFKMRFIHFDEYEHRLVDKLDYNQPEGRLIYIDAPYSQAVFLTNFLMQDKDLLKPIFDVLDIRGVNEFRIIIQQNKMMEPSPAAQAELPSNFEYEQFELTSRLRDTIDKFKKCATCSYLDQENNILYLDYGVTEETKKAFLFHFQNDPLVLFRAFQILLTLNLYEVSKQTKTELYQSDSLYVNETVPTLPSDKRIMRFKEVVIEKAHAKEKQIYSKALSDGEHQFLHAMGISLLFKDTNSLFLFDEPETHFNPDWRASLISTLRKCFFYKSNDKMRELLISSHSPFIVSDCHQNHVLVFDKSKDNGEVTCQCPDFNTFGASVNLITMKVFGKQQTISNMADEKLKEIRSKVISSEITKEAGIHLLNELGDSLERTLLIDFIRKITP